MNGNVEMKKAPEGRSNAEETGGSCHGLLGKSTTYFLQSPLGGFE
jgi:hypothetical protein